MYARIPSAFRVDRIFRVAENLRSPSQWEFVEELVASPFTKDYDALPNNRPTDWPRRYDTRLWRVFAAFVDEERVGGAILITPPLSSGVGSSAISELWDLRVHPAWQRRGVASALWTAVEGALSRATVAVLRVETQQLNVPGCRFYGAHGCTLIKVEPHAYPTLPNEVRLTWQKVIPTRDRAT